MGEYKHNFNYYTTISTLRESCKYYPVELQLIWLVEILLLSAYMANRENCHKNSKGLDVFYFGNLLKVSKNIDGLDHNTLRTLVKFRNVYVHEGAVAAQDYFNTLVYAERPKLLRLAELAKIELNLGVDLYTIYGV